MIRGLAWVVLAAFALFFKWRLRKLWRPAVDHAA